MKLYTACRGTWIQLTWILASRISLAEYQSRYYFLVEKKSKNKILKKNQRNLKILWKSKKIKIVPKITPLWPQKWKNDLKNENFRKKYFFLKSSNNLEKNKKIKNLPKNSPQNDLKNEKMTSKMKILKKNENFENFQKI